jgi:hypothetical protein
MRLACIYALLDKSPVIREEHLKAAVALWKYCLNSAQFIFGAALGDPVADTILAGLRGAPAGLDRTAISSSLFKRHKSGAEISRALTVLREHGLARLAPPSQDATGRPREVWFAVGVNKGNQAGNSNGNGAGPTEVVAATPMKNGRTVKRART